MKIPFYYLLFFVISDEKLSDLLLLISLIFCFSKFLQYIWLEFYLRLFCLGFGEFLQSEGKYLSPDFENVLQILFLSHYHSPFFLRLHIHCIRQFDPLKCIYLAFSPIIFISVSLCFSLHFTSFIFIYLLILILTALRFSYPAFGWTHLLLNSPNVFLISGRMLHFWKVCWIGSCELCYYVVNTSFHSYCLSFKVNSFNLLNI